MSKPKFIAIAGIASIIVFLAVLIFKWCNAESYASLYSTWEAKNNQPYGSWTTEDYKDQQRIKNRMNDLITLAGEGMAINALERRGISLSPQRIVELRPGGAVDKAFIADLDRISKLPTEPTEAQ